MAHVLLRSPSMFRLLHGRQKPVAAIQKQWLCVSCLEQIALDSHGRCSNCGSDAVDRIPNLEASNRSNLSFELRSFVPMKH